MRSLLLFCTLGAAFLLGFSAAKAETLDPVQKNPNVHRGIMLQGGMFIKYNTSKPPMTRYVDERIRLDWSCSSPISDKHTEIRFFTADDGKIYNPEIGHYSGDDQHDAECLEAVCGMSPVLSQSYNPIAKLQNWIIPFGEKYGLIPKYDGKDVIDYRASQPQPAEPDERFIVVHKIPLDVLNRYPQFFSKDDLLSTKNLIEIRIEHPAEPPDKDGQKPIQPAYVQRVGNLYAAWGELFKKQGVTKKDILEWAEKTAIFAR
jgi:hypothetical protein